MPPVEVHLIAHSHTDPGWLNTVNDYYGRDVKPILTGVIREMEASPNRTFAWSETCFFARWFGEQSARKQAVVRQLVAQGRLEFVGGGWVSHDEALPTVGAMLEQMAEGHAWLNETFGVQPTVGWQLDPFGHSATSSAILGRMGFKAVVINRINYALKARWSSRRALEFQWEGVSPSLHWRPVFTHVLVNHYSTPKGLDFEGASDVPPRVIKGLAATLRAEALKRADSYRTGQLMILIGDDFRWRRSEVLYRGWDAIIAELRRRTGGRGLNVHWSTPARYFAAAMARFDGSSDPTGAAAATIATSARAKNPPIRPPPLLPSYGGDLLPYADNRESFWTGYYATKPRVKQLARSAGAAVHAAQLLVLLARARLLDEDDGEDVASPRPQARSRQRALLAGWHEVLVRCRREVATVQHHDAITGTSRLHVIADYEGMLTRATSGALSVASAAAEQLLLMPRARPAETGEVHGDVGGVAPRLSASLGTLPPYSTTHTDAVAKATTTPLLLFNPLPFRRCTPLAIRVRTPNVSLLDLQGRRVPAGIVLDAAAMTRNSGGVGHTSPAASAPKPGSKSAASAPKPPSHFVWSAPCVPALGFTAIFLRHLREEMAAEAEAATRRPFPRPVVWGEAVHSAARGAPSPSGGAPSSSGGAPSSSVVLRGSCMGAKLDPQSGMLSRLLVGKCAPSPSSSSSTAPSEAAAREVRAALSFLAYPTYKSGAYIMRTSGPAAPLEKAAPSMIDHQVTEAVEQVRVEMPRRQYTVATRVYKLGARGADGGEGGGGGGGVSSGGGSGGGGASDDDFAHVVEVELTVFAPRNREVVLRLHTSPPAASSYSAAATSFYTHDGLAWRRRGMPPGEEAPPSPAAAFFPTSVGAALAFAKASGGGEGEARSAIGGDGGDGGGSKGDRLTVLFDRSVGIARLPTSKAGNGDGGGEGLEFLIHRSLAQDDGRGLFGPAFDDNAAKIRLWLLWGEPSPQALRRIDRLIFGLQAPPLPLRYECGHSTFGFDCGGDDVVQRYRQHFPRSYSAVATEPPYPMILWPRAMGSNSSSQLLLRLQRSCTATDCADASVGADLASLFAPPVRLRSVHEVGLTGGPLDVISKAPIGTARLALPSEGSEILDGVGSVAAGGVGGQNSAEDGVFVSDSAIQLRDAGLRPRRRLLVAKQRAGTSDDASGLGHSKSREFTDISDGALEVRAFECFLVSRGSKNTWPEVEAVEKGERSTLAVGVRASIRGPSGVSTLVRQRPTSTTPMLWWLPLVMGGAATFLLCFFGWRRRLRFLCCTRARK